MDDGKKVIFYETKDLSLVKPSQVTIMEKGLMLIFVWRFMLSIFHQQMIYIFNQHN